MKRIHSVYLALLLTASFLLTACGSTNTTTGNATMNNEQPQVENNTGTNSQAPANEGVEAPVLEFELNDTFQTLLDEVNTAHEAVKISEADYMPYVVQYEEPGFDINKYRYNPAAQKSESTVLTLEQVAEDMEVYYKALRTNYHCAYTYFGGDEAFRTAVDGVVADCAALEVITCGDVLDSMEKRFAFVKDAHFSFGGRRSGELHRF